MAPGQAQPEDKSVLATAVVPTFQMPELLSQSRERARERSLPFSGREAMETGGKSRPHDQQSPLQIPCHH